MKSLNVVLIVSAAVSVMLAASCVTKSAAITTASTGVPVPTNAPQPNTTSSGPASIRPKVAREPNHVALAMKHVTEKSYLRQLKRLDDEISAAEGLLNGLDEVPTGVKGSPSSADAAPKRAN